MNYHIGLIERRMIMPRRLLMPLAVIAVLWMPAASNAQSTLHDLTHDICVPDCIRKWCCDDYCCKPIPCPVPVTCFGCDCYQPKPLPCPVNVTCFRCDDYCSKPYPCILCPPSHYLKCAPALRCPWPAKTIAPESNSNVPDASSRTAVGVMEPVDLADPPSPLR